MSWEHVEGWLYDIEGEQLARMAKDQIVLEVGSYKGRSACAMAQTATRIDCCDHFTLVPDEMAGNDIEAPETIRAAFMQNTRRYTNIHLYEMPFEEFTQPANNYGFIFYDAGHSYEACRMFVDWLISCNYDGAVAFHDYGKPDEFPGTIEAVDWFRQGTSVNRIGSLACFGPLQVRDIVRRWY